MSLYDYFNWIIIPILGLSVILVFIRFLKGPSLPDRVIALDMLILISVCIIAIYSIQTNQSTFLDVAMLFALIAFLSTSAYAFYLEQRQRK
ncbi:cation:proton antiporter [Aquiflexum sp. XJ19-10]|jgi:multicomponent Na+:H+ antiporter subunit F|uniref:Cation:proton antiporter n=1 Tax=Aquiflexum gelatinilyticum TaxID=2961943 RepID=A0A9X2PCG0_9BACT|nr:cation:proton antiporter [Aquiflexum gelatinilyticum]MCR9017487.1 cation:proton antiporter [Aquiflexum gelatinilyticum]MCS4434649.1 cation:proton antiporter [Aquiflexum gelatinilyticum]